jgi:RNA-binding protein
MASLERLGRVEEVTNDGRLIVECDELPEIGDPVFDNGRNRIGTVKRVFGPVDKPYASIVPDTAPGTSRMKGIEIFYKERQQNGKNKRRNRRDRGLPRVWKPPSRT